MASIADSNGPNAQNSPQDWRTRDCLLRRTRDTRLFYRLVTAAGVRDMSLHTIGRLLNREGEELQRILNHACSHGLVRRHERTPGNFTYETLAKGHAIRGAYQRLRETVNADAFASKAPLEGDIYRLLQRIHTHGPISVNLAKSWLSKETRPAMELINLAAAVGLIEKVSSTRYARTPAGIAYEATYRRILDDIGYANGDLAGVRAII